MSGFVQFSEPARLYAQNWGIVDAMAKEFRANVEAFFDSLREQVSENVVPAKLQERRVSSTGNRYWWLADDDREKDRYPQLWFGSEAEAPAIVHPGELRLVAVAPTATKEQIRRLAEVANQPAFASFCKKPKGTPGKYSLFTALVRVPEHNPVDQVAEPVASVLRALSEAHSAR